MNRHLQHLKTILLFITAAGILFSCSKKDDEKPADQVVGNWNISSASFDETVNGKTLVQYLQDIGGTQSEIDSVQQMLNSVLESQFSGSINIKSDNTYTITIGGTTSGGTWSINSAGDKITITPSGGDPVEYDIIKLDSNNLEVKFTMNQYADLNQDGTPETVVITIDMKLSR